MLNENFVLVRLDEKETKELARLIAKNETTKIIDYLSIKEATDLELSQQLKLPLKEVQSTLSVLSNARLVEADDITYAKNGTEICKYHMTRKYSIIAPKTTFNFGEHIKKLLPAISIAIFGALGFYFDDVLFEKYGEQTIGALTNTLANGTGNVNTVLDSTPMMAESQAFLEHSIFEPEYWHPLFNNFFHNFFTSLPGKFFIGCSALILIGIIAEYIKYKIESKKD